MNHFGKINENLNRLQRMEGRQSVKPREEYNPFMDKHFNADKLEQNEIQCRGQSYAKLPKMSDRVFMRDCVPEGVTLTRELDETDIAFLADRYRDEETGGMHDEVVVIGSDISSFLAGMMLVGEHYHEYFDISGRLVNDPLQRRMAQEAKEKAEREQREAEKRKKAKKTRKTDAENGSGDLTSQHVSGERTVDEIKAAVLEKEKELDRKLREVEEEKQKLLAQEEENRQLAKELRRAKERLDEIRDERLFNLDDKLSQHVELMHSMLNSFSNTIDVMAKRKPNSLMSLRQIRTVNEILAQLQYFFSTSSAGDYLHLAEEPREDDLEHYPGTTYGEMSLLIDTYLSTYNAFTRDHLYQRDAYNPGKEAESGETAES